MEGTTERQFVIERFREAIASPVLDLFETSLLISRLIDPGEDVGAAGDDVDRLAARVVARRADGDGADRALRRVLFEEEGFRGDADSYDDPDNSSVSRVLARRKGMPITLSIIVIEIARRAGLRLTGVGLPGHFVVGGPDLPAGTFLDPFDGGRLCDRDDLTRRVAAIFGSPVDLPPEIFAPDSTRSILTRVLFNLRRSWEKRDMADEALAALDCAEALEPGEPSFLRERGLLLLKKGDPEAAVRALETYVASTSGEDSEAVEKLIAVVKERTAPDTASAEIAGGPSEPRVFTFDEAKALLPKVQEITSDAVLRYARIGDDAADGDEARKGVVQDWAHEIVSLGVVIKGLWLVDFDAGAGYYCWKYPEPSLEYFHGYDEGFAGRLPLQ